MHNSGAAPVIQGSVLFDYLLGCPLPGTRVSMRVSVRRIPRALAAGPLAEGPPHSGQVCRRFFAASSAFCGTPEPGSQATNRTARAAAMADTARVLGLAAAPSLWLSRGGGRASDWMDAQLKICVSPPWRACSRVSSLCWWAGGASDNVD